MIMYHQVYHKDNVRHGEEGEIYSERTHGRTGPAA